MPDNQQYDSLALPDMVLPYAPNAGPLINKPFVNSGSNTYTTWGGTLKKRPGFLDLTAVSTTFAPERLWIYETLEANPVVYAIISVKNGSVYQLMYLKFSSPSWSVVTERRGCNHSTLPHEGVVRRGKLYIKSFPGHLVDPTQLGCIYLDGTGGTMATHDWGALGPQTPVALSNPAGWGASAHAVTVLNSWIYTYTYVKVSGQETDQAPLQTNPDASPSASGPFTNKIPDMNVVGLADTTEYPFINIYRTTDGGGSFFFLHQIANTGAGTIDFKDKFLASGSGNADPVPDAGLDTRHQAPSTTSNSPPPTVAPPLVTGTDDIQGCSKVVTYAARIWYGINEYLFYSGNEEIDEGVPEECFPSGEATPNFFRMTSGITNMIPTPDGLLVMTRRDTTLIQGTSRATFNPRILLDSMGAAPNQHRAACTASSLQAWLTHDYRIAVINGQSFSVVSNPLGNIFKLAADAGAQIDMQYWTQSDKEYLIVACERKDDTTQTQWFVYDMDRARRVGDDFWFTPWQVRSTAIAAGASSATDTENKLYATIWDGTKMRLCNIDYTGVTASDINPTTGAATAYSWTATSSLLMVPAGDHVNLLRRPDFSPVMASFQFERTTYGGDMDPLVFGFFDDLFTNPIQLAPPQDPARRAQSLGFKTALNYDVTRVAKYSAIQWQGFSDTKQAEIHNCTFSWLPDSGA